MGGLNKFYPILKPTPEVTFSPNDVNDFIAAISTRTSNRNLPSSPEKTDFNWDVDYLQFQFKEVSVTSLHQTWSTMKNKNAASYD